MIVEGDFNPKIPELVLAGKFNWDKKWKVKSGKKTIYKGRVYRDRNHIRWVDPPSRIMVEKDINIYCGKLLIITFDIRKAMEYYKCEIYPGSNFTLWLDYRHNNEVLKVIQ